MFNNKKTTKMKTFKKILVSLVIASITIAFVATSNYFLDPMWTNAILLFALGTEIVFALLTFRRGESSAKEATIEVHAMKCNFDGVVAFLETAGEVEKISYLDSLKDEKDQPALASLPKDKQTMKTEERSLRNRLLSNIRLMQSDKFKEWSDDKKREFHRQVGAMRFYHIFLFTRCLDEGVLLTKDDSSSDGSSSSSSSDSSSSSSSDSSSSDSSSSDVASSDDDTHPIPVK